MDFSLFIYSRYSILSPQKTKSIDFPTGPRKETVLWYIHVRPSLLGVLNLSTSSLSLDGEIHGDVHMDNPVPLGNTWPRPYGEFANLPTNDVTLVCRAAIDPNLMGRRKSVTNLTATRSVNQVGEVD